jgi:hypothetical protein
MLSVEFDVFSTMEAALDEEEMAAANRDLRSGGYKSACHEHGEIMPSTPTQVTNKRCNGRLACGIGIG